MESTRLILQAADLEVAPLAQVIITGYWTGPMSIYWNYDNPVCQKMR